MCTIHRRHHRPHVHFILSISSHIDTRIWLDESIQYLLQCRVKDTCYNSVPSTVGAALNNAGGKYWSVRMHGFHVLVHGCGQGGRDMSSVRSFNQESDCVVVYTGAHRKRSWHFEIVWSTWWFYATIRLVGPIFADMNSIKKSRLASGVCFRNGERTNFDLWGLSFRFVIKSVKPNWI